MIKDVITTLAGLVILLSIVLYITNKNYNSTINSEKDSVENTLTRPQIDMASIPTDSELNEFKYITTIHKNIVKYLGGKLNNADYTTHDDSKFTEPEINAYTLKFVRSNCDLENWETAKWHHFLNNKHHVQYWNDKKEEMPHEYLSEAVIDMMSAKFQYALFREIVELVRVKEYEINEALLRNKIDDLLMTNDEMYFFKEMFLKDYTESQKNFIKDELKRHKDKWYTQK